MAKKQSAGILMYRFRNSALEVFLVHPGGPYWAKKDSSAWSIPKGLQNENEDLLEAARREFHEETGLVADGKFLALAPVKQPGGKVVQAWAVEGNCDASAIKSNTFSIEWPPRSGRYQQFPEVDRAGWFTLEAAKEKISKGQLALLDELERKFESRGS
jgi:predicted NUDIX family NTP pyrophosphohydrolase